MIMIESTKRKWWVLAAMACSISIIFIDQSIMPVTLPTIQKEFHISELGLQWLINAYLLTLTAFVLAGGRLGDMLGHRRIFCIGMFIFTIASLFCGFSRSAEWFIFSRGLQGIGGALILPTAPAMLSSAFPLEQQGRAFGFYISIGAFFLSIGPMIGGLLTQFLNWRYVFWINIPIAILGLILTFINLPKSVTRNESFDYLGFVTNALGVICIIVGLMQGKEWGWTSWVVPSLIFTGIFLILALALFDRDVKDPFIDFNLFRDKSYVAANCCVFVIQFLLMLTIFWAVYFQTVLHYTPSFAGLWAMISTTPVMFFGQLSGYLSDKLGPKIPIISGFICIILGITWFILTPTPSTPWKLLPLALLFGSGVPMVLLPSFTLAMTTVPQHKRGIAVGINSTLRQFSATLGMAVFGQTFLNLHSNLFSKELASNTSTSNINPVSFEGLLSSSQPALEALQALPHEVQDKVYSDYLSSYIMSSSILNAFGIVIAIIGLLSACFLIKRGKYASLHRQQ
jgi:EmrB/QacA subfamily drug resistance transporter